MPSHCIRCKAEIERAFKACPHCGEPVTAFLREYADRPVDGKYRLIERLGAGGMGEVYKVEHTFLGAVRVIKVIRAQIADSGEAHDRFLREARLATKVHHPNVATLHDFSALPDGSHYMVWEFIDGQNLAQLIRARGVLPPRYAVQIATQVLAGLDAIHRAGIVHRDISPENLMMTRDDDGAERIKIIDLGVAKGEEAEQSSMTKTGMFVGKLRYCSPEHLGFVPEGEKIDGRADLYSLGIVLVEMLTGRPPFEATSPHQYIVHHSRDTELKPIDFSAVPAELQPVLARALERDRKKRFATAREFSEALGRAETSLREPSSSQTVAPPLIDSQAPTQVTPLPSEAKTIRTPVPARRTEIGQVSETRPQPARSTTPVLLAVIALLLAVVAVGAYLVFRKPPAAWPAAQRRTSEPTSTAVAAAPAPSQTNVEVTAAAAPPPAAVVTAATTVTNEPVKVAASLTHPRPTARMAQPPAVEPQPAPASPSAPARVVTYTERGDSSANEEAVAFAQQQLHGVSRVAVDGAGDPDLVKQIADNLRQRGLTVAEGSEVAIHFDGKLERLGRGRKRRSAEATITRDGRPLFRYVMPAEEYRVGDNPADAFARVLNDLFSR